MEDVTYPLEASLQNLLGVNEVTLGDLLEVRELLRGGSVVDWRRLHFRSVPAVNELLRVAQYDPDNRVDLERLFEIHKGAVEYLRNALSLEIPQVLAHPHRIQNVFLYASTEGKYRSRACMLLKAMHVINHLEARELLYHLPISERELFSRVEQRVSRTVSHMMRLGFPIDQYVASQKTKESLITKILSKSRATAAQVFDRIRFRIIVAHRKDIVPVLLYLKRHLFPFPDVIPGESNNTLTSIQSLFKEGLDVELPDEAADEALARTAANRFSHKDFRVVAFVVDIPLRVDEMAGESLLPVLSKFGHIVYIPTEFQVFDKATYYLNESGPASHSNYKARQVHEVIARLYSGANAKPEEEE